MNRLLIKSVNHMTSMHGFRLMVRGRPLRDANQEAAVTVNLSACGARQQAGEDGNMVNMVG
jgi:hypothetical protein